MKLTGIIAISGKPGLFKVVAQGKNSVIVESLIDNKKIPAYSTDRISALEDISIYTYDEETPLKSIFKTIYDKENGGETISHKESNEKLVSYIEEVIPNYDRERVYVSDIKKLFQWYNLLLKSGNLILEEAAEEVAKEEVSEEKKTKKKAEGETAAKKVAPKKVTDKPKVEKVTAKSTGAKKVAAPKTGSSRGK